MNKAPIFSTTKTKSVETVALPGEFNGSPNLTLLAQAFHVGRSRIHVGLPIVQTRGDVNKTTKKVYRQKGTGGARHGAKSAPIFVGGGKAHGPTGLSRILTLPKKMKVKARASALSLKAQKGQIVLVEGLGKIGKTKDAGNLIDNIVVAQKLKAKNTKTLLLSEANKDAYKFFQNVKNLEIMPYRNLSAYKALTSTLLIIDNVALETTPKTKKIAK